MAIIKNAYYRNVRTAMKAVVIIPAYNEEKTIVGDLKIAKRFSGPKADIPAGKREKSVHKIYY